MREGPCDLRLEPWVLVQVLKLAPYVTLGKFLFSLGLSFRICAMGVLVWMSFVPLSPILRELGERAAPGGGGGSEHKELERGGGQMYALPSIVAGTLIKHL